MTEPCACDGRTPCLFHYAQLSLNAQLAAAHRAGVGSGVGSVDGNRKMWRPSRFVTGRAEQVADD